LEFKVSITNNKVLSDQEIIYVLKSALMKAIRSSNWRYGVKIGYIFFKVDRESFFAILRQSTTEDLNPKAVELIPAINEISKKVFWHDIPNLLFRLSRYPKWYQTFKEPEENEEDLMQLNDLKHSMDSKVIELPIFSWVFDEHCRLKGSKLKDFSLSGCWYNRRKIAQTSGAAVNKPVGILSFSTKSNQITATVNGLESSNENEQPLSKKE